MLELMGMQDPPACSFLSASKMDVMAEVHLLE